MCVCQSVDEAVELGVGRKAVRWRWRIQEEDEAGRIGYLFHDYAVGQARPQLKPPLLFIHQKISCKFSEYSE